MRLRDATVAIGAGAVALWWLALAALFFVVVPTVILIASGIVTALKQIRAYAADILQHGVGLAANLDPVPELITTKELVKQVAAGMGSYGAALEELL